MQVQLVTRWTVGALLFACRHQELPVLVDVPGTYTSRADLFALISSVRVGRSMSCTINFQHNTHDFFWKIFLQSNSTATTIRVKVLSNRPSPSALVETTAEGYRPRVVCRDLIVHGNDVLTLIPSFVHISLVCRSARHMLDRWSIAAHAPTPRIASPHLCARYVHVSCCLVCFCSKCSGNACMSCTVNLRQNTLPLIREILLHTGRSNNYCSATTIGSRS